MIHLEPIDRRNFYQVLELERPAGEPFVAPNSVSLAEAWLYRDENTVHPAAIYDDDTLVGFVMTHDRPEERIRDIWRILIPERYVNRGYGSRTLAILIRRLCADPDYDALVLSYVPGNAAAEHVYRKAGFQATGKIDDGEVVMRYEKSGQEHG
jgi:diamine N-acetyltransferase